MLLFFKYFSVKRMSNIFSHGSYKRANFPAINQNERANIKIVQKSWDAIRSERNLIKESSRIFTANLISKLGEDQKIFNFRDVQQIFDSISFY